MVSPAAVPAAAPDLAERTFVVTGGNAGIGKATALALAQRGARVILASRSAERTRPVLDELRRDAGSDRIDMVALDLAELASVRKCASDLLADGRPIHGLINNAGLAAVRGATRDGFELAFGTNHLGHYLLTRLLLDRLRQSARPGAPSRVVNVSSDSHYGAKAIDWDALRQQTRSLTGLPEYGVSKLANVLFTRELARRNPPDELTAYAVHPGVIASDMWTRRAPRPIAWLFRRLMKDTSDGCKTTVRCATAAELATDTGRYYAAEQEKRPSRAAQDATLARTLWERSAEWTGLPE